MEMLFKVYLICYQLMRAIKHIHIISGRNLREKLTAFLTDIKLSKNQKVEEGKFI